MTLAGIATGLQVKYSKKGNRFCIFRLEDQSTGVKCLAWAEAYAKFAEVLKNDELLIVGGRVEAVDGQEITFIVNEVTSLGDAEARNAKSVSIRLPVREFDDEYFYALFSALSKSQGHCEVFLNLPVDGLELKIHALPLRIQGSKWLENDLKQKGCSVSWRL
ncbi:MAG: hypothetical protein H7070_00265 [Saprospiraceae bacterium]|nr:hypothetical protein [Pyrinomonadaceae bacterium]